MAKKSIDDFMLAEYARLVQFSSTTISMREGRMNYFLTIISGAIVALSLLHNLEGIILLFFIDFVLIGIVFWIGIVTFRNIVRNNFDIVRYQEDMERIKKYFVEADPKIEEYLSPIIEVNRKHDKKFPRMNALINSMIAGAGLILLITRFNNNNSLLIYSIALAASVVAFFTVYGFQRIYFVKALKKVNDGVGKNDQIQPRRTAARRKV